MNSSTNGYILSEAEYNALDKALTKSNMADDGQFIYQKDGADYFGCYDPDYLEGYICEEVLDEDGESIYIVPILEYLPELDECFDDFEACYGFTKEDMAAYKGLLEKAEKVQDLEY